MNLPRLGFAVIVNNVASEMVGSRKDVASLKAAYETIGFDVHIYEDCSAQVKYWNLLMTGRVPYLWNQGCFTYFGNFSTSGERYFFLMESNMQVRLK